MSAIVITEQSFAAAAERLPTTPQVFERLNAAMRNPNVGVDEIVAVVQLDAALSARVMRLSNSAFFGRGEPLSNLDEAINRVGFQEIYRLVGAAMSSQLFISGLPVYGVGGDELGGNSLATALAMEFLAESTGQDRRVGYTLGLLRPVGRLLLQRVASGAFFPPLSGRKATGAEVIAWERSNFGIDNADAAERLFDLWRLSQRLASPIRFHLSPTNDPEKGKLTALLHVASSVAAALDYGLSIEKSTWAVSDEILLQAGLSVDAADKCVEQTRAAVDKLQAVLKAA